MRLFTVTLPEDHELILFGDNQEGNAATAQDKFKECIEYILEKPKRYGIHMGDAMEGYWVSDKRYSTDINKDTPLVQLTAMKKMLGPLVKAKKLITCLKGNHEDHLISHAGDLTAQLCEDLRKECGTAWPIYGTYSSKIDFLSKKGLMYRGYFTHGRKTIASTSPDPIRRLAYMKFSLKRHLETVFGDCVIMAKGHAHKLLVVEPEPDLFLTSKNGKIHTNYTKPSTGKDHYIPPELRWYACTGSFLRTFIPGVDTYSEMAEYGPVELGYIRSFCIGGEIQHVEKVVM